MDLIEVKIKNEKGVVVINRIHIDKYDCHICKFQDIRHNDSSGEEVFLSSLVSDKKIEEPL